MGLYFVLDNNNKEQSMSSILTLDQYLNKHCRYKKGGVWFTNRALFGRKFGNSPQRMNEIFNNESIWRVIIEGKNHHIVKILYKRSGDGSIKEST